MAGTCERTVSRWIAAGVLRAVKRGRIVRIETQDVLTFLDLHQMRPRGNAAP